MKEVHGEIIKTTMTMSYELITPEVAKEMLKMNTNNRKLSRGNVESLANDMRAGHYETLVGSTLTFGIDGRLLDGQHRLHAVIESCVSIPMWVCRGASITGLYDICRRRSTSDQISIVKNDYEGVYKTTRLQGVTRFFITHGDRRTVSPAEQMDFIDKNKELLDRFFLNVDQSSVRSISLSLVHTAMFMAFCSGESIDDLNDFYEILKTGMSSGPEAFPIIAYRNYLKDYVGTPSSTKGEISRCQYAIKKYITKSCIKRTMEPNDWIYPVPEFK